MKKIIITICFMLTAGIIFGEIGLGFRPFGAFDINPVPTQGEDIIIDASGDSSSIMLTHMMSAYFGMDIYYYFTQNIGAGVSAGYCFSFDNKTDENEYKHIEEDNGEEKDVDGKITQRFSYLPVDLYLMLKAELNNFIPWINIGPSLGLIPVAEIRYNRYVNNLYAAFEEKYHPGIGVNAALGADVMFIDNLGLSFGIKFHHLWFKQAESECYDSSDDLDTFDKEIIYVDSYDEDSNYSTSAPEYDPDKPQVQIAGIRSNTNLSIFLGLNIAF